MHGEKRRLLTKKLTNMDKKLDIEKDDPMGIQLIRRRNHLSTGI
jgi:hypothetical protein